MDLFHRLASIETDDRKKKLLLSSMQDLDSKSVVLRQAAQGDVFLDSALSIDSKAPHNIAEIIPYYISAAEEFYAAVKTGGNDLLKKRLTMVLDRIEELKLLSGVGSLPPPPPSRPAPAAAPTPLKTQPPQKPDAKFSLSEMNVLKMASRINGKLFLPWVDGEEVAERFRYSQPFVDPDGPLPLSKEQITAGAQYRRPRELVRPPTGTAVGSCSGTIFDISDSAKKPIVMIRKIDPLSVSQDLVSDCSFNSSGIPVYNAYGKYIVKLYLNGAPRKIVVDDFLPVDSEGRLLCSSGECDASSMELWVSIIEKAYMKVNGGYDFPGSNSGIDLYALTGWIPEQVYFEDNMAVERLSLDHRQSEDRAWNRMKSAMSFGDCLVTISTAPSVEDKIRIRDERGRLIGLSVEDEEITGLVPSHAYAVLDVQELCGLRLLKVKNPWAKRVWKGRFSSSDTENWTPPLRAALGLTDHDFHHMAAKGIFWIDFSDCRNYFKGFFLNWNPALFSYRYTLHAIWPASQGPRNDTYYVGDNPQYSLSVHDPLVTAKSLSNRKSSAVLSQKNSVWILLSRHVVSKDIEMDSEQEQLITVHIYKGGKRIFGSPSTPYVKGVYSSDPHRICRFDIESDGVNEWHQYTAVLSQIDKHKDLSYSLSVFATTAFSLNETAQLPQFKIQVTNRWSMAQGSNGGPQSAATFYLNPQYRLDLVDLGDNNPIQFHFEARYPKEISANICIIKRPSGSSDRVEALLDGEVITSSGDYRPGFCYAEESLCAGVSYTIVVSAYSIAMEGPVSLTVAAPISNFRLNQIEEEGSGLICAKYCGSWSEVFFSPNNDFLPPNVFYPKARGTAAGCSNYGRYSSNPTYAFRVKSKITIAARLTMVVTNNGEKKSIPPSNAMNISIFPVPEPVYNSLMSNVTTRAIEPIFTPKMAHISSNGGVYSDRSCGVSISKTDVGAGCWAIVISTFDPTPAEYELTFFSSVELNLTALD